MKNLSLSYAFILPLYFMFVPLAMSMQILNFGAADNFIPYTWNDNGQAKGIDVDVVQEMCRRVNLTCNIEFLPWKRVMLNTKSGMKDGALSALRKAEREVFAHYLQYPIHFSTYNIFVKRGHEFEFNRVEDLYGKTIGKNLGWATGDEFDEAVAQGKIDVEEVKDVTLNLLKLTKNRIQGYIGQTTQTLAKLIELGISREIVYLPYPFLKPSPVYLIISKAANISNKAMIIKEMNLALKDMYDDGTIDKINQKYLGKPEE